MPSISQFKRTFFDARRVTDPAERVIKTKLSRFGAFTRRTAKTSIKKAPKVDASGKIKRGRKKKGVEYRDAVSKPGDPPFGHGQQLYKKFIYFGYDAAKQTVIIGPALFKRQGPYIVPEIIEKGGDVLIVRPGRRPRPARFRARPAMQLAHDAELPKFMVGLKDSIKPGA